MSWPHAVMYLVVIGVGLPSAWRNPTAFALVLNWALGEFAWLVTNDPLPLSVYFCADILVLAVISGKATIREGCRTYPTLAEQIRCFWRVLTLWDKLVAGGFIFAAWPLYVADIDARLKWFALFYVLIAQFAFAGCEAISNLLGYRKRRVEPNRPPGGLAFAGDGGRG